MLRLQMLTSHKISHSSVPEFFKEMTPLLGKKAKSVMQAYSMTWFVSDRVVSSFRFSVT